MPIRGVHHIILTVSDVERSRHFYHDVLGFATFNIRDDMPEFGFSFMAGDTAFYCMLSRQPMVGDSFSEDRIGLDHVSFTADSQETLEDLVEKLHTAGVLTNGIETFAPTGKLYVAFRDPDNIQLEYLLP